MNRWNLHTPGTSPRHAEANHTHGVHACSVTKSIGKTQCILIALALVLSMLVGMPVMANAADTTVMSLDSYYELEDKDIASGDLTITVTTRDDNGNTQNKAYSNPSSIDNIAMDQPTTFALKLNLSDATITGGSTDPSQYNLDLRYPLPVDYSAIGDEYKQIRNEMKNGEKLGSLQIVEGENDKAELVIRFDRDYVTKHGLNQNYWVNYTFKTNWDADNIPDNGQDSWEFPGISNTVDVTWSKAQVSGGKSCYYTSDLKQTCEVKLTAEADMQDFDFKDVHGADLTVNQDFRITANDPNNQAAVDAAAKATFDYTHINDDERSVTMHMGTLPKGDYTITYTTEVKDTAQANASSGKYDGAKNSARWQWKGGGPKESTYYPWVKGKSYNWVSKTSGQTLDADGNVTWTVNVNSGADKADLSGYRFTDELQQGSDGEPTQHYTGNLQVYRVEGNADGGTTETLVRDDIALDATSQSFSYDFPSDAGSYEYKLVYRTTPIDGKAEFKNKGTVCHIDGDSCSEQGNASGYFAKDISDIHLLKKTHQNSKAVEGHPNVREVPWTIDFDPQNQDITELNFYEDWTSSDSDGNTLHMWYSQDALNLSVKEYTGGEGCSESMDSCWKDVTGDYQILSRDGRELPKGYDYPAGWFHDGNAESGDTWKLHDGSPSFKLWYRNDGDRATKKYDKKMRISYTTLFDKNPDVYHNYAKFSYKVGGMSKGEVVEDIYTYSGGNHIGKSADAAHEGGSDFNDAATFETAETVKNNYKTTLKNAGMSDADAETKAAEYVRKNCPNGRWRTHWRVWGNGVKSWWMASDTNNRLNGIKDLSGVKTITMTDTLPKGWKLADDYPTYGRFVNDRLSEQDRLDNRSEHWESFKLVSDPSQCVGVDEDGNAATTDQSGNPLSCGTYAASGTSGLTFTVPNEEGHTLTAWTTSGGETLAVPVGPASVQGHSTVVFGFDTYITPETANDLGYKAGTTMVFTNHAGIQLDGQSLVDNDASGTASIKQDVENVLGKWGDVKDDNTIVYTVDIDKKILNFVGNADSFQLVDELDSPNVEYLGDYSALVDGGSDPRCDKTAQVSADISIDPVTRKQSITFTIPKNLTDPYDGSDDPKSMWIEHGLKIKYTVRVKGVVGQQVTVRNSIKLKGNEAVKKDDKRDTTIKSVESSMGAQGDTRLTKTDAALHNPKTLPGTKFTVCKVDISETAINTAERTTCDGAYSKTITTGSEGQATLSSRTGTDISNTLYGLATSTLYAAVETQAPNGYQLDAAPYYFYLRDTNDAETDQLKAMKEYVTAHRLTVESNDEIHARDQKISTISWSKVKAASATIDDSDKATLTGGDSAYLAGSSWAICTDNCGTDEAAYVYVADNGKAEVTDSGNHWLTDQDARDGYITISGFKQNTVYQVTEVSAPDGYRGNAGAVYTFEITGNGNVTVGMLDSDGRNVPSTSADFPALAKAHGFAQLEDGSWIVTNSKIPLTSMPFTGRANWLGVILAAGLALAMVGYRLTSSSGKERRPKRIHARE